jgi:hypothetical protein
MLERLVTGMMDVLNVLLILSMGAVLNGIDRATAIVTTLLGQSTKWQL